eukprot:1082268-Amphidinium_carterae.3
MRGHSEIDTREPESSTASSSTLRKINQLRNADFIGVININVNSDNLIIKQTQQQQQQHNQESDQHQEQTPAMIQRY